MLKAKTQKPKKVQKRKSKKPIPLPISFLPDESIGVAPDYPRLLKALKNASPGQLFFLQINSPLKRKHLPELLKTDGMKRPYAIADFDVLPQGIPPYQVLRKFLKDCGPCEILYVDGLEHIIEANPKIGGALEALVMGREILTNLGVAVVFLLPLYLMVLIRNHALNLWIWRAHDYNLDPLETSTPSVGTTLSFDTRPIAPNDTPESRERRIRILQRLLEEGEAENRSMESLVSSVIYPLANDLFDIGRYDETRVLLLKTLKFINKINPFLGFGILDSLAHVSLTQGEFKEAENILKKIDQVLIESLKTPEQSEIYQRNLNNLATVYQALGRIAEAKPLYQQALDIGKKLYGEEHPAVATNIFNIATIFVIEQHYDEAETLYLQALEIRKKLFGKEHPDVATSIESLAILYGIKGHFAKAEQLHWQAMEMKKKLYGEEHPAVATSMESLANLYGKQDRFAEAEQLHRKVLEMRKKFLGERHPDVAGSLYNLSLVYFCMNDLQKAEPLMAEALKLYKDLLGEKHPNTIIFSEKLQVLRTAKKKMARP